MYNQPAQGPRRRLILPLVVVSLMAAAPRTALAAPSEAADADASVAIAEQKAAQAFEAYQAKRFTQAVALYIEAYDAAPNADILYNIARVYDTKLGDRPLAINFYRRYITDPGAVPDRIQLANERLLALRDAEAAASQPAAAPSSPSPAPPARVEQRLAAPASGWTSGEWAGVLLAATGVVGIGLGTGFGLAALDDTHTMRDLCDGAVCRSQRGIDAAESATDYARFSTIGFASGGALLALGAAFFFWSGGERAEHPQQAGVASLELGAGPSSERGGWSVELSGAW
jgi:tetratricopeptide (TPR) repeat protein